MNSYVTSKIAKQEVLERQVAQLKEEKAGEAKKAHDLAQALLVSQEENRKLSAQLEASANSAKQAEERIKDLSAQLKLFEASVPQFEELAGQLQRITVKSEAVAEAKKQAEASIKTLQEKLANAEKSAQRLPEVEAKKQEAERALALAEQANKDLQEELERLRVAVQRSGEIDGLRGRVSQLEQQNEQLVREMAERQQRIDGLEKSLFAPSAVPTVAQDAYEMMEADYKAQLAEAKQERFEAAESAEQVAELLGKEIEDLQQKLEDIRDTPPVTDSSVRGELVQAQLRLNQTKATIAELEKKLDESIAREGQLERRQRPPSDHRLMEERDSLKEMVAEHRDSLVKQGKQLLSQSATIKKLQQANTAKQQEIDLKNEELGEEKQLREQVEQRKNQLACELSPLQQQLQDHKQALAQAKKEIAELDYALQGAEDQRLKIEALEAQNKKLSMSLAVIQQFFQDSPEVAENLTLESLSSSTLEERLQQHKKMPKDTASPEKPVQKKAASAPKNAAKKKPFNWQDAADKAENLEELRRVVQKLLQQLKVEESYRIDLERQAKAANNKYELLLEGRKSKKAFT